MKDGGEGEAVGGGGLFVGPTEGDGGDGHNEARQVENADDVLRRIDGGAEIAEAQSFCFGQRAEGLAEEEGIGGGIHKGEEIVVARACLSLFAPAGDAVEIGAEGEEHGGLAHHGLVEMAGRELLLLGRVFREDNTVELEIAHCLCALGFGEEAMDEGVVNRPIGVSADGLSVFQHGGGGVDGRCATWFQRKPLAS